MKQTIKASQIKSTNRINDILTLIPKGYELLIQINTKEKRDKLCWLQIIYCAGNGNAYQYSYGGIKSCKEGYENSQLSNSLKNYQDMHLCQVRVKSKVYLSFLITLYPLLIKIYRTHISSNIIVNLTSKIERLNLLKSIKNNVLLNKRADHKSVKGIKLKLLASMNDANKKTLF